MRLAVELAETRLGTIEGDARTFDFMPSTEAIDRFGINSVVLSVAIPLTSRPARHHAGRRRNWFAELLPEGDQYAFMLQQSGLRQGDTPGFLARYGRDVAGALQIWDLDDPTEPPTPSLRPVSDADIRLLLEDPLGSPLANSAHTGRSSLGGVQPKIVLALTDTGWAQAHGGAATTHILKPQLPGAHSTVIFDEEYGARLSRAIGLSKHSTRIQNFDELPTLVIERYDRVDGRRVHQEDGNQALGASGNEKYQELGGVTSLKRIADVLTRHTSQDDLLQLARMMTLTAGIGNLDFHAKNISLLHHLSGDVRLAPAYDVVPHAHLASDGKLAFAVNGRYRLEQITAEDLVLEARSWGISRAETVVHDTLEALRAALDQAEPLDGAHPALHEYIRALTQNLLDGKTAGPGQR